MPYDVLDKYDSNVYYIYAMDCDFKFRNRTLPKIWFEVTATNGGSHFSHEDQGVMSLNLISLAFLVLVLGFSIRNYF